MNIRNQHIKSKPKNSINENTQYKKFTNFLESMKPNNPTLIESIKKGFKICYESVENIASNNDMLLRKANPFNNEPVTFTFADGSTLNLSQQDASNLYHNIKENYPDLFDSPYYTEDMMCTSAENFKKWINDLTT